MAIKSILVIFLCFLAVSSPIVIFLCFLAVNSTIASNLYKNSELFGRTFDWLDQNILDKRISDKGVYAKARLNCYEDLKTLAEGPLRLLFDLTTKKEPWCNFDPRVRVVDHVKQWLRPKDFFSVQDMNIKIQPETIENVYNLLELNDITSIIETKKLVTTNGLKRLLESPKFTEELHKKIFEKHYTNLIWVLAQDPHLKNIYSLENEKDLSKKNYEYLCKFISESNDGISPKTTYIGSVETSSFRGSNQKVTNNKNNTNTKVYYINLVEDEKEENSKAENSIIQQSDLPKITANIPSKKEFGLSKLPKSTVLDLVDDLEEDHADKSSKNNPDPPKDYPAVQIRFSGCNKIDYLPQNLFPTELIHEEFKKDFKSLLSTLKQGCSLQYSFGKGKNQMGAEVEDILSLLDDNSCIGDEIINPYMFLLWDKSKNKDRFEVIDSLWYTRSTPLKDFKFKKGLKYLIPIHGNFHWTLLVVNYEQKGNVQLEYYDSLGPKVETINDNHLRSTSRKEKLEKLTGLLNFKKFANQYGLEIDLAQIKEKKSPHQSNGVDCGLYTLFNTKQILSSKDPSAVENFKVPHFRAQIAFDLIHGKIHKFPSKFVTRTVEKRERKN